MQTTKKEQKRFTKKKSVRHNKGNKTRRERVILSDFIFVNFIKDFALVCELNELMPVRIEASLK